MPPRLSPARIDVHLPLGEELLVTLGNHGVAAFNQPQIDEKSWDRDQPMGVSGLQCHVERLTAFVLLAQVEVPDALMLDQICRRNLPISEGRIPVKNIRMYAQ